MGPESGAPGRWAILKQKKRNFNAILKSYFILSEAIWKTKFLKFKSYFKELNCFAPQPPLLLVKSKIGLNARILRLNFPSDFANGV